MHLSLNFISAFSISPPFVTDVIHSLNHHLHHHNHPPLRSHLLQALQHHFRRLWPQVRHPLHQDAPISTLDTPQRRNHHHLHEVLPPRHQSHHHSCHPCQMNHLLQMSLPLLLCLLLAPFSPPQDFTWLCPKNYWPSDVSVSLVLPLLRQLRHSFQLSCRIMALRSFHLLLQPLRASSLVFPWLWSCQLLMWVGAKRGVSSNLKI